MKINKITKKILLKDGLIIDPFKEKKFKGSILIENGFISKISNEISDEDAEKLTTVGSSVEYIDSKLK